MDGKINGGAALPKYLLVVWTVLFFGIKIHANDFKYNTIRAIDIKQSFSENDQKNVHPRLFFTDEDMHRIKTLIVQKDTFALQAYRQLSRMADNTLKSPLYTWQLDAGNLRIFSIHDFSVLMPSLIFMYRLTGEEKYAERCIKQMEIFGGYPDFGADRHFLDTGIAGFNFAMVYDALYTYLNRKQKKMLRQAVMDKVLLPAQKKMEAQADWHMASHNWNAICNGGIIMAALAMYENDKNRMSYLIALAANGLPSYISSFEPDGQSKEGLSYWCYGLLYTSLTLESMNRVLGTAYNLDQAPGFKKSGWFPINFSGPVISLNVGDDPVKTEKTPSYFWFAKHYDDPALAQIQLRLCQENQRISWPDILFYDPDMIRSSVIIRNPPLESYIRGIEVMSLRDSWDKEAFFVAMHGGSNNITHAHLDAGTFFIQAMGEVWAYGGLGNDDYNYPGYFLSANPTYMEKPTNPDKPGRWHMYRLRAEGHNCLVFNPSTTPDQNENGTASVTQQYAGTEESSFTLDLSNCYQRDVRRYTRTIDLDKIKHVIRVSDDYTTVEPAVVWWSMHTQAKITLSTDRKSAILQRRDKKMKVTVKSPADATFQVLKATYLPDESFPLSKNSNNNQFRKLVIKLENQSENTVCVEFSKATF